MKCPTCNTHMQERNGTFGLFAFCPNQAACKQKTISKASFNLQGTTAGRMPMSQANIEEVVRETEPLMQEVRIMEAELGPLFVPSQEDFVNDLGDPVDYDGAMVGNSGEWFRPY